MAIRPLVQYKQHLLRSRPPNRRIGAVLHPPGSPKPVFNLLQASARHWRDAELLQEHGRPENADHLFGLSAECALKAALVSLGFGTTSSGDLRDPTQQEHVDQLWGRFRYFAQGRSAARYAAQLGKTNPFHDWRVTQRYLGDGYVKPDRLQAHRAGAFQARKLLEQVVLDTQTPSK